MSLRFLVDAQLPPALARWLRDRGHNADHIRDLGLDQRSDIEVVRIATRVGAIVVTKDSDFSHFSAKAASCQVVWIRLGNAPSADLLMALEPIFADIEAALAGGQKLIEVSR